MEESTQGAKMVVADDNEHILPLLVRMAEHAGFEVVGTAQTWPAAVELVKTMKPDMVVCDVNIPPTTAIDAIEHFREASEPTLIVLTSAGGLNVQAVRDARSTTDGYIDKTDSVETIVNCLAAWRQTMTGRQHGTP